MTPHGGVNYFHLSGSAASTVLGGAGGDARLVSVTVNTGASTAVTTIYDGASAAGNVVATISSAAPGNYYFGGARMRSGQIGVYNSVASSDITVTYV